MLSMKNVECIYWHVNDSARVSKTNIPYYQYCRILLIILIELILKIERMKLQEINPAAMM